MSEKPTIRELEEILADDSPSKIEVLPSGEIRARADDLNIEQHHVADAFWKCWKENGETHKHGYYESTWMSIRAALDAAREGGGDGD